MTTTPAIRVSQYRVQPGQFTGLTFVLKLNRQLLQHYFVMISPTADGNTIDANQAVARVTSDPFGTGDLEKTTNADELVLTRGAIGSDWVGTIQVVEAERDRDGASFRLLDVVDIVAAPSTAVGVQTTTRTVRKTWNDLGQVVPFGGWRGGGSSVAAAGTDKYPSTWGRLAASGADQLDLVRFENTAAGDRLDAANVVAYVVEWGSAWQVDRVTVVGGNFGLGTIVAEWNAATIASAALTRAATWLWGSGYTEGDTPATTLPGMMLALGDGVTENATETDVATNWRHDHVSSSIEVWALSHPSLVVEWFSEPFAKGAFATFDTAVVDPITPELRDLAGPHDVADIVTGRRAAVVYTSANANALPAWPAAIGWQPLFSADDVLNIRRPAPSSPSTWASRIQSIDFGAVVQAGSVVNAGALTVAPTGPSESTTGLVLIPDHADRACRQLILELQKARITALAAALATGVQTLEDLTFQLIVDRTLATAAGAQLDQYGAMVGEQRGGLGDAEYRRFIAARTSANESGGSTDEMIVIWVLVTAPSIRVREIALYPAAIHLQVVREVPLTDEVARRVVAIMEDARPSGIALQLVEAGIEFFGYDPDPDALGLDVGAFARLLT